MCERVEKMQPQLARLGLGEAFPKIVVLPQTSRLRLLEDCTAATCWTIIPLINLRTPRLDRDSGRRK